MEQCVICGKDFDHFIRWDYEDEPVCEECERKMLDDLRRKQNITNRGLKCKRQGCA